MRDTDLTRRLFIRRTATLGAVTVGSTYFLAACGGGAETGGTEGGGTAALDCSDTSALTPQEVETRTSLQYVEKSVTEGKNCLNCQQFQAPATAGECGKCLVVPGSINPDGNCTAWVEKVS
ncbi:hypothetical protein DCC79_01325 [bacterium]|nr:hypothetical protein [Chloroflexi bacterium CFX6]RIL12451.1 MAG: hypothetical protein DCC79_01325 [bacterium]